MDDAATTRMSADPKLGVVDGACRVHGVRILFIGGSSVVSIPGQTVPMFTIVKPTLRPGVRISEIA